MVSAFLQNHGLVLGQLATDDKSNETTAIHKLLDLLKLKDALVTLNVMGCQRRIAQKIQECVATTCRYSRRTSPSYSRQSKYLKCASTDPSISPLLNGAEGMVSWIGQKPAG